MEVRHLHCDSKAGSIYAASGRMLTPRSRSFFSLFFKAKVVLHCLPQHYLKVDTCHLSIVSRKDLRSSNYPILSRYLIISATSRCTDALLPKPPASPTSICDHSFNLSCDVSILACLVHVYILTYVGSTAGLCVAHFRCTWPQARWCQVELALQALACVYSTCRTDTSTLILGHCRDSMSAGWQGFRHCLPLTGCSDQETARCLCARPRRRIFRELVRPCKRPRGHS